MAKDAYYFPHDSNARNDPKIRAMRTVYGSEGYGWYFMLIEILREQEDYRLPVNKYTCNALAMELGCQPSAIEKFLKDCCQEFTDPNGALFTTDQNYLWSESLLRRMFVADSKRIQAKNAANKRWNNEKQPQLYGGNAVALLTQSVGNARKGKERKGNKRKLNKNIYGEFQNVLLTDEEYNKLKERFADKLPGMVDNLSIAIASKGYKYKNHYATILSWERKGGNENGQIGRYSKANTHIPDRDNGYTEQPFDPELANS